jgi:hypothetical protein
MVLLVLDQVDILQAVVVIPEVQVAVEARV